MPDIKGLLSFRLPTPIQQIIEAQFADLGIQLFLKRDDLIHPDISGNKWRKLMAGIISAVKAGQKVIGFPVLKNGAFLEAEIQKPLAQIIDLPNELCQLITHYHFGGYAKHTPELLRFIRNFKTNHAIELDFIYTGKMMYGLYDLVKKGFFPKGSRILAIHTGGLQGNKSIPGLFKSGNQ